MGTPTGSNRGTARECAEEIGRTFGVPDVVVVDARLWRAAHVLRAFAPLMVDRAEGGHLVVTTPEDVTRKVYVTTKARCGCSSGA